MLLIILCISVAINWFDLISFHLTWDFMNSLKEPPKCSDTPLVPHMVCVVRLSEHYAVSDHYDDVIMTMLASQITSLTVVYSVVHSGVNQRKHQSSASLAFVREIHRGPVNFPHKWPVTRKMFPFDDVIMDCELFEWSYYIFTFQAQHLYGPGFYISNSHDRNVWLGIVVTIHNWHCVAR